MLPGLISVRAGTANKGGPYRTKHVEMHHGLLLHPPTAQVGAGKAGPPYLGKSRADPPAPRRHADGRTTAPPSGPRGRSCPSPRSCRRAGRPARLRPVAGSYNSGSYRRGRLGHGVLSPAGGLGHRGAAGRTRARHRTAGVPVSRDGGGQWRAGLSPPRAAGNGGGRCPPGGAWGRSCPRS